jgi:phosphohistidine phosphatase
MRYLTIVRHCEAEPGTPDVERTLTERGRRQAQWLRTQVLDSSALGAFGPTTALVSGAARTRETYALAFAGTPFVQAVETSELIYNGRREVSGDDLLATMAELDPVTQSLLIVAHNPSVLELVLSLADHVPTVLREGDYPLGGAFVFALDDAPVARATYPLVGTYVPTV